jgi:ribonuclease-3
VTNPKGPPPQHSAESKDAVHRRLEGEAAEFLSGVTFAEGDQQAKLDYCQQQIGYQFRNVELLLEALTHASGATHRLASNERLEFLGDAILGMVICDWLYHEYPEYSEGDLTKIKSAVVSRRTCGTVAKHLHLERCLIVGKGVTRNRSYPKSLVSDVFESIVAAIYLDGGLEAVRPLLRKWLAQEVNIAASGKGSGNHKSQLQQVAQKDLGDTPVYRLLGEMGPDHSKSFQVVAVIGKRSFAPAWGRNKKEAEQRAAGNAIAELENLPLPFPGH